MIWIHTPDKPVAIQEIRLPYDSRGWLVIDSTIDGQATGGVRFGDNVSLEEVRELAAAMTLKFSFLNLPLGGAKSGIRCPSALSGEQRKTLFLEFGKALEPLLKKRLYQPGGDMGTSGEDIEHIFEGAGMTMNSSAKAMDSGFHTAISVFAALRTIMATLGIPSEGAKIGVQGLGKVGLNVIRMASEHGLKIVAVSTRNGTLHSPDGLAAENIIALADQYGDDMVSKYEGIRPSESDDLFALDMDILCPCAGSHPIHAGNIEQIKANVIIPGCNAAASSEIENRLFEKGIAFLPGFVCNSGGILCYLLANYGFEGQELSDFLDKGIREKIGRLFVRAKNTGISPARAARDIVRENQRRFVRESEAILSYGKIRQAYIRFASCGLAEMIRTLVWPWVHGSLRGPDSLRKRIARNILFRRIFQV